MTVYAEVEDELRDLLADDTARIVETYPIWLLLGHAYCLHDARPTQQFHHQVHTAAGPTYAQSTVADGHFDLDEVGNEHVATSVALAARYFAPGGLRLLLAPARQMMALWKPDIARVSRVALGPELDMPIGAVTASAFEAWLARLQPESPKKPAPRATWLDTDPWGARATHERHLGGY